MVKETVWEEHCILKMDTLLFLITTILLLFQAVLQRIRGFFRLWSFIKLMLFQGGALWFIVLSENRMVSKAKPSNSNLHSGMSELF